MTVRKIAIPFSLILFLLTAFVPQEPPFPVPKGWPKPVYDFSQNPPSQEKITLGRALFYDPILSRDSSTSCASCHSQYTAFAHVDHALSHGIHDSIGTRNAPSLQNLAWARTFMWDGAIRNLDFQALAPLRHPAEMDEDFEHVLGKLRRSPLYPPLFLLAYGDTAITGERFLKSISLFMSSLVSAQSKYDSVMQGRSRFTSQEKNGYRLFKKHCAACHAEPLFTNGEFRNNGLAADSALMDFGRMKVTQNPRDSLCFKVPTLRNVEFSYPYMHDGRMKTLRDVLNHYTGGIQVSPTLSTELARPIRLSSDEKVDLTAFLLTLTDRSFLFNKAFSYPREIFSARPKD